MTEKVTPRAPNALAALFRAEALCSSRGRDSPGEPVTQFNEMYQGAEVRPPYARLKDWVAQIQLNN